MFWKWSTNVLFVSFYYRLKTCDLIWKMMVRGTSSRRSPVRPKDAGWPSGQIDKRCTSCTPWSESNFLLPILCPVYTPGIQELHDMPFEERRRHSSMNPLRHRWSNAMKVAPCEGRQTFTWGDYELGKQILAHRSLSGARAVTLLASTSSLVEP